MFTVAGIDASTTKTGIAIMSDGELMFYTLIDLHKTKDAMQRVRNMMVKICDVLERFDIDAVYMEKAFNSGNIDTTIKLANLSGGVMLYCAKNDIDFVNPLPTEWRARIGIAQSKKIKRDVLKEEAIRAVKNEYGIDVNDDTAESILISRSAFDLPKINITEDDLWE